MIVQVHNREDAARFTAAVHHTRITFADWLKERTYRSTIPPGQVPKWVSPNQKWWYTHRNARRALKRLEKLIHARQLFVFLTPPGGVTQDLKSTTNLLEGGINKQLKDLAGNHRGMFDEHQRITMDWWLFTHGPDPRKVDTSGASYAALVSIAEVSVSKTSGATRLHQECRLRVL